MAIVIINPGKEARPEATITNALAIAERIAADLKISVVRNEAAADRDGFFGFVAMKNGRSLDLDIPGDDPDEFFESRPLRSRRMYVDGSTWLWGYAAGIIEEKLG